MKHHFQQSTSPSTTVNYTLLFICKMSATSSNVLLSHVSLLTEVPRTLPSCLAPSDVFMGLSLLTAPVDLLCYEELESPVFGQAATESDQEFMSLLEWTSEIEDEVSDSELNAEIAEYWRSMEKMLSESPLEESTADVLLDIKQEASLLISPSDVICRGRKRLGGSSGDDDVPPSKRCRSLSVSDTQEQCTEILESRVVAESLLEEAFQRSTLLYGLRKRQLARQTGLNETEVVEWFNRRKFQVKQRRTLPLDVDVTERLRQLAMTTPGQSADHQHSLNSLSSRCS